MARGSKQLAFFNPDLLLYFWASSGVWVWVWAIEVRSRRRAAKGLLDPHGMRHLSCCVCLEELDGRTALLLPCCGRAESSTRCCSECLRRCCDMTGSCPACRRVGLRWVSGRAYLSDSGGSGSSTRSFLWQAAARSQISSLVLWILGMLLYPLDLAFTQALEAVCSRGPV